jgi:hypothetical protein
MSKPLRKQVSRPDDTLFETKFSVQLDDGVVTIPLRVKRWAEKRGDAFGAFVLAFVVPWLEEVWVKIKTKQTMKDVDRQAEDLVSTWESEEDSMITPTYSEKVDLENPFGVSEMRLTSDFMEKKFEE